MGLFNGHNIQQKIKAFENVLDCLETNQGYKKSNVAKRYIRRLIKNLKEWENGKI